jgi:caffeoyl-CoA O-methyltransferase
MIKLVSEVVDQYCERHTQAPEALFEELRQETLATMRSPQMQVGAVEGQFLRMLCGLVGARRVIELGMFTGYSALMMAAALPSDGELITCDIDPKAEAVAKRYFAKSPHGAKIKVRMGPALQTLASLQAPFDLAFIDADKTNYPAYFQAIVPLMRPGGLIVADNVLWSGAVADPGVTDEETQALRAYAAQALADPRVESVMLSVRDGMLLSRKK